LATGRYVQRGDNLLLLGPPGVGESHLAIALGIKACEQGVRNLFVTAAALIATLGKALAEGKLDERLKLLTQPQLLICDEIGYLPIDRQGANLFFQLVSRRYERGDHHYQQPESGRLGRGLRRHRDCQRDSRSASAPFDYHQHQRRKLQA
jgi:DNA replication protein DnaC